MKKHTFEEVKELFESKGYTLLETEYQGASVPMAYICKSHEEKGIQYISYDSLNHNHGCKYCANERRSKNKRLSYDIIKEAFEKRNYQLISAEYINCHLPLEYICLKHPDKGVQTITYVHLMRGQGCQYCKDTSYGAMRVSKFLDNCNVKYIKEYEFHDCKNKKPFRFDFYLPDMNVIIEYDGEQHFMPRNFGGISDEEAQAHFNNTQRNDAIKTQYCIDNNIKLIRIPYWEKDNIEQILKKELNIY